MIKQLLPPSIAIDENISKLAQSGEDIFSFLLSQTDNTLIYSAIDRLQEEVLDLLAWQFHIEGYEFAKDLQTKRKLIKSAVELHRLKGTTAGIKKALELAGAELVKIYTPHHRTFLSVSLSDEERREWLSQFPELRLVHFAYRGRGRDNRFITFPCISDAQTRFGIRGYIKKAGNLMPLKTLSRKEATQIKTAIEMVEVRVPGKGYGIFYRLPDRFLYDHSARKRIYSVLLQRQYTDINTEYSLQTLTPSTTPIASRYEEVYERGTFYRKQAYCLFLYGHTTMTDAERRIYKSIRIYDDDVVVNRRRPVTFLNEKPITIPAYNAELKCRIRGKYRFRSFLQSLDKTVLQASLRMLSEFKSARDKILLDTKTKRELVADGTITADMNITLQEVIDV